MPAAKTLLLGNRGRKILLGLISIKSAERKSLQVHGEVCLCHHFGKEKARRLAKFALERIIPIFRRPASQGDSPGEPHALFFDRDQLQLPGLPSQPPLQRQCRAQEEQEQQQG